MVALVQPSPFMFTRQLAGNGDDLDYQDMPQSHYSAPPMTSYEASIAADHLQYPRQFGAAPYGFDNETWLTASNMYEGRPSPPANAYDDANLSSMSAPSPTSSAGSPPSQPGQLAGGSPAEWPAAGNMVLTPGIAGHGGEYIAGSDFSGYSGAMEEFPIDFTAVQPKAPSFVDPSSLLNQEMHAARSMGMPSQFDASYGHPVSPALSPLPQNGAFMRSPSHSPPMGGYQYTSFAPMEPMPQVQRPSPEYDGYAGEDSKGGERQRCPHPDCGKTYKDLKAHMLTHQPQRPEKCPIQSCEYHHKGFSRKYDRNRHTLTHYKGNMVCGFCPGPGSASEKSFNRADVFKRHLTAVHNVEQTPPNSRKKGGPNGGAPKKLSGYAADATGKCSTCSGTFSNAQEFYEHLDECVLRIVQLEDPAEAVNAQRLAEVEHDRDVHATLEKNHLPINTETVSTEEDEAAGADDDEMTEDAGSDAEEGFSPPPGSAGKRTGAVTKTGPANGVQKSRGMTHSRRGQPVAGKVRGRKGRRDYPSSWGYDKGQMTMKKRVMTVFEGQRRLAKDDMMVSTEREVRLQLGDGRSYVTDLDVAVLNRAAGFQTATEEEKGPWLSDDPTEEQVMEMRAISARQQAARANTPNSNA